MKDHKETRNSAPVWVREARMVGVEEVVLVGDVAG